MKGNGGCLTVEKPIKLANEKVSSEKDSIDG